MYAHSKRARQADRIRAGSRGLWTAAHILWKAALWPLLSTALALAFLLACDLLLFRTALVDGQIYSRSDTVTYYFPIADRLVDVLREGRLLLWTRYLFGGFPLFADGETGMLYPPNLLAYLLLSEQEAFIWLRVARYFLAALFTYAYLRALRLNGFAATIGALSFAFGSFMVGQMHHTNVGNTALWLPLTLYMVEKAVRNVGRWRWIYATGAGASTGVQALGLHIQPLLMSGLLLAAYIPFRVMLCPLAWPSAAKRPRVEAADPSRLASAPWPLAFTGLMLARALNHLAPQMVRHVLGTFRRSVLAALLTTIVPVIGFGIAAVQVLPLVELGSFSFRGAGVTYEFATSFSMPVQNIVNLAFPYFFRYANRFYWSLWAEWETTLYFGIAPLILASIALLFVRNRMVLFFAAVAVAGALLTLGSYSPYPLFEQLRQLPGFASLRVPGRFSMLVTFSGAVLAAFGADWLCRTLRHPGIGRQSGGWDRLSRAVGTNGFALYLVGLMIAMAAVVWWLASLRIWIEKEPVAAGRVVQDSYLAIRSAKPWLTSDMVLYFLRYSLDPTNEKTAASLALMLATLALLFCWFAFRRLWPAWAALLVLLVAWDMLMFATDFHPTVPVNRLVNPSGAGRWLMAHNRDGRERVYTSWEVRETEANKLLPFQVPDMGGYSSLETTRHQDYVANLSASEKLLLDLYNVRYLVLPSRFPGFPSYEYTAYNPNRPLAVGPRANRGAHAAFYMTPPVKADEVSFISSLRNAVLIPQDAEVADIVVVDTDGERLVLKARAGKDTAEWAYDRPDVTPHMHHQRAEVADTMWVTDPDGLRYQANLYYGNMKLDRTRTVASVEFHFTSEEAEVRLFGMMLWERPQTAHQIISRKMYIPRYQDDEVVILENPSPLPRAWLVPTARVVWDTLEMDTMLYGDFDPEKVALLEIRDRPGPIHLPDAGTADRRVLEWLHGNPDTRPGTAEITSSAATEVVIRTESDRNALLLLADSYYPGWKALVDGREEKIYRANYLFRAVPIPKGKHEVRFAFEPESFALGARISTVTTSVLLALWGLLLIVVPMSRGTARAARWLWERAR